MGVELPGGRRRASNPTCARPCPWQDQAGAAIKLTKPEAIAIQVDRATTRSAMRAAFDTWEAARCGEGNPAMHAEDLKPVECDKVEYNKEARRRPEARRLCPGPSRRLEAAPTASSSDVPRCDP